MKYFHLRHGDTPHLLGSVVRLLSDWVDVENSDAVLEILYELGAGKMYRGERKLTWKAQMKPVISWLNLTLWSCPQASARPNLQH